MIATIKAVTKRSANWEPTVWERNQERQKNDVRPPKIDGQLCCWLALFLFAQRTDPSAITFIAAPFHSVQQQQQQQQQQCIYISPATLTITTRSDYNKKIPVNSKREREREQE